MDNLHLFFTMLIASFLATFVFTKVLIPIVVSKKAGQRILEIGPSWHKSKEGTPTMGGIGFVLATFVCFLIFLFGVKVENLQEKNYALILIIYAILNALIGFIDDLSKVSKKQNKGLSARSKFILQAVAAIIFLILMNKVIGIDTTIALPFTSIAIDIGILYYPVAFLLLCGFVNAVNLTDGVDGLAASVTSTVAVLFSIASLVFIQSESLAFISSTLLGAMLAFLIFNVHPAKIFMGDTGSLFLGAIVVGVSFLLNNILLVLIYGIVYLIEALSVMLQVGFFKISKGKRLLKMAPLHHHFEKCGWSENKVVIIFTILNGIFCLFALIDLILL